MPQIASGGNATVNFVGYDSVTVEAGSSQASFEYPVGNVIATFSGARTFGPYEYGSGKVNALVGPVNYQFADGRATARINGNRLAQLDSNSGQILANSHVGRGSAILNDRTDNTIKLRTILNSSGSGNKRGRIWQLGTSVLAGAGARGTLYANNGKTQSAPMLLSKMLNAMGLNSRSDYTCGDSGSGSTAAWLAFDTRNTVSGAVVQIGVTAIGGSYINLPANATWTFTPGGTFDTVEVGYAITTGAAAQFGIGVDGGTTQLATVVTNAGATAYGNISQAVTAGSTAVTLKNTGTQPVYIDIIGTRTSTAPTIEVINGGFGGSVVTGVGSGNWNVNATGAGWGAVGAVNAIDASINNVFILEALINDVNIGATLADYLAGQTAFIQRCQAKGEVYFRIPATVADTGDGQAFSIPRATWNLYADAARDNAIALGCVVFDERIPYPDWATTNALGLFSDGFHGNGGLYNGSAQGVLSLCRGLV